MNKNPPKAEPICIMGATVVAAPSIKNTTIQTRAAPCAARYKKTIMQRAEGMGQIVLKSK